MNSFKSIPVLTLTVAGLIAGASAGASQPSASTVPYATPAGITLVNVSKMMDDAIPQYLWRRLGDENGKPLYTFDQEQKGRPACYDACAKEFTPFVAAAGAKADGDFSIVGRKDKVKQWAYQGKPLYRFAGTDPKGEPVGQRFQLKEDPAWADPASNIYSPKDGWRRASFNPEKSTLMPPDVKLTALALANGFAFVEASTKMTLYVAPRSAKLGQEWQPLRASALALPVGAFTIVKGATEGSRQWAYKGELLYTFAEDYAPGEVSGTLADKQARTAIAYQNFMPEGVTVGQYLRGPLLTTSSGATLYTQSRYSTLYGGTETRTSYAVSYNEGKTQGSIGCAGDCTATWKPLVASANAQARGFWEVYSRPDGTKQWAFKGVPLYTYTGDSQAGDTNGNNRHVIVYGGAKGQMVYANAGNDPRSPKAQLGALAMKDVEEGLGRRGGNAAPQTQVVAVAQVTTTDGPAPDAAKPKEAPKDGAQAGDGGRNNFHSPGFYWHTAGVFY